MSIYDDAGPLPADGTVRGSRKWSSATHAWVKQGNTTVHELTATGSSTFQVIPILPSNNPTQDNQATRKAWVDSRITHVIGLVEAQDTTFTNQLAALDSDLSSDIGDNTAAINTLESTVSGLSSNLATMLNSANEYTDDEISTLDSDLRGHIAQSFSAYDINRLGTPNWLSILPSGADIATSTVFDLVAANRSYAEGLVNDLQLTIEDDLVDGVILQVQSEIDSSIEASLIELFPNAVDPEDGALDPTLLDFSRAQYMVDLEKTGYSMVTTIVEYDGKLDQIAAIDPPEGTDYSLFYGEMSRKTRAELFEEYKTLDPVDGEYKLSFPLEIPDPTDPTNPILIGSEQELYYGYGISLYSSITLASTNVYALGEHTTIFSSDICRILPTYNHSMILASSQVELEEDYVVALGYNGAVEGLPSPSNIKLKLYAQTGNIWTTGTVTIEGAVTDNNHAVTKLYADGIQTNLTAHIDDTGGVHGAVSGPTADALIVRDTNGRAQVADPADAADIATMGWVTGEISTATTDMATQAWVTSQGYATETWVTGEISTATADMATQTWVINTALSGYATETWVTGEISTATNDMATQTWVTNTALSGYATETYVGDQITALNLGTMSTQDASDVAITGGDITVTAPALATRAARNIVVSSTAPTGMSDGDIWIEVA